MERKDLEIKLDGFIYGSTEIYGTHCECTFNDLTEYKKTSFSPFVTAVKVWHGDVIDGVEFVYDKDYSKGESPFFHGGKNGYCDTFNVPLGDFVQTIEGEYGKYPFSLEPVQRNKDVIIRLRFITREGKKSQWFGNICGKGERLKGTPFSIDVGKSNVICALQGALWKPNMVLHNYLQSIGGVYMTYLDAVDTLKFDQL